ncbi:hypothetical protein SMACR_08951 [Sordaria macrospora]|uniref:WGS project CABT00000000 data, contig 2.70 n=2 Tax=Sordaria macrospora TaxID=5147 RepID=F7WB72_SORMK|nr:uncharacterized protein SMAC_08951 [Sordaria macrospora k-hell]KAA8631085.1 hypothetical protein SMACR_08951 [Sordaria macrospora]KAH7629313.1 hypothetical protein B0T09DRAFT_342784 [Sordaria sp. MPI-SDFR-AT-0083]WPJ63920.1 hypothetical protein SMAC4_08951 [Sordaria macrospora]CCC14364.1 unnamed protein product [Sordaria macrospora k-hell]
MTVLKAGLKRDDYSWRQIRPGLWQRDADEAEVFYSTLVKLYEGSGRMQFAITGHITLRIHVPEDESVEAVSKRFDESLRIAWLRQRYETPAIASKVHYDALDGKWKKSYRTIPDDASTKAWLETFQVITTGQTGGAWANSDPPAPEVATLFVVCPVIPTQDPSVVRRDLILRSPHDIIDGIGTLHFLNSLVTKTAEAFREGDFFRSLPVFDGSEASNLSPPYRIAANVPSVPTPEIQARLDALESTSASLNAPSRPAPNTNDQTQEPAPAPIDIGIPYNTKGPLLPSKSSRKSMSWPQEHLSSLTTYIKTHCHPGTTVTHVFHAAIALTLRNINARRSANDAPLVSGQKVRYTNYLLRNERPSCLPPYDTPAHCVSVYHSLPASKLEVDMAPSLPASSGEERRGRREFETIISQIRDFYVGVKEDRQHFALAPGIWAEWTRQLGVPEQVLKGEEKMPVPKPKKVPSVSISSMGVVEQIVTKWHDLGFSGSEESSSGVPQGKGEEKGGEGYEKRREGKLEVQWPWVSGDELSNGLGVFLRTFDGRLEISVVYNEAWHSEADVKDFLSSLDFYVESWMGGGGMNPDEDLG